MRNKTCIVLLALVVSSALLSDIPARALEPDHCDTFYTVCLVESGDIYKPENQAQCYVGYLACRGY